MHHRIVIFDNRILNAPNSRCMKRIILLFALIISLAVSCSKTENSDKDSLGYFQTHLKADMKYDALVDKFGNPDGDIGSGIHIYVYNLSNGTSIRIGYTDKILYARHVDANDNILHTLI